MRSGWLSRRWSLVIIGIGIGLSAINIQHLQTEQPPLSAFIGGAVPLVMTLGTVAIGTWVWRQHWDRKAMTRLILWLLFGVGWMTIVGIGLIIYASTGGRPPPHSLYLIGTFASYGSIPGLLTGWVDIQRRDQELSLRQFKQTVESSKDLLAAIDTNHEYLFANNEYRQYHGIETGEIAGRSLADVLDPEEFDRVEPMIETALYGRPVQTEISRENREGEERILDVRLFPLEGSNGDIRGVGASMRDVTEDRKREAAIERESEYRRLMSDVNQALVRSNDIDEIVPLVADLMGSSHYFTCTFIHLLDTAEADVTCARDWTLDSAEVEGLHTDAYVEAVFEAGALTIDDVTEPPFGHHGSEGPSHSGAGIAITHDGEQYGVLTVHVPTGDGLDEEKLDVLETIGNNLGYFIYNRNLAAEHRTFTDIVERIDDPVMLQDRDGTFRVLNDAVADFAGMDRESLIGSDETAFMDETVARTVREMKQRVIETEQPVSYQVSPRFPDGRERTFSTTRYPSVDDQGNVDGTLAICRDVTDLKEHQRQLQVLDRVLRHNVSNNMNVVLGYAEMIRDATSGDLEHHATAIMANSETLLDIADKQRKITEFLSDVPPIGVLDLDEVVTKTVRRVRSTFPTAEIAVHVDERVHVTANRAIGDAIEELLTNSIVHANRDDPSVIIEIRTTGRAATVSVIDTNQTISEMDRGVLRGETISELHHGSGLGLWFVKLVVDHSSGSLAFEENEPRGNVVRIELPRAHDD
ncbi:Signal transduction histidine kinase with PAS domain [Halanaeroarchaeum sp. HSR-CO]|uniref:PAS domain-containing protein n=1 Tax=Halanaeroarchaeum sp. HSR-CO TaxID=2866382 RepID=UPI00217ED145|nr:PAS domain-containing protein [Halanaeroarchaeum sp. HSR-CO]UWG48600.1 Signal transduction histidine kinase with PAS domain [Halanaeroarchaeum sp. HSR-CO]